LVPPTTRVKTSYLIAEEADGQARGHSTERLAEASTDFDGYVEQRSGVQQRWGVPYTQYWYVSGEYYLGSLVIRHELTADLLEAGGNIGYHVPIVWGRQGHATRMLGEGLTIAKRLGLERVLLTCDPDNAPSRKVIIANGGRFDGNSRGEDRFWIDLA
jgi:predicted acetyltransferase